MLLRSTQTHQVALGTAPRGVSWGTAGSKTSAEGLYQQQGPGKGGV